MKSGPRILLKDNLLMMIGKSAGSALFQRLYFKINGRKIDVLENGNLSCAFFVSSILKLFGLVSKIHTTVKETVNDMRRTGWRPISKPRIGAVVIYAPKKFKSGSIHKHIGFYVGKNMAISNSSKERSPKAHRWNYRPVEEILWHKQLEN